MISTTLSLNGSLHIIKEKAARQSDQCIETVSMSYIAYHIWKIRNDRTFQNDVWSPGILMRVSSKVNGYINTFASKESLMVGKACGSFLTDSTLPRKIYST